ncbi:hypothetical protein HPP92_012280 [Vanilla planifolia]|uniref:Uncharacterized protein n=1 Tax=Vanilla planifolia TaxID=51239 RepID=A0A835R8P3_VANPL|nr:hypothetical protein HPP92_012280 [Vanilla planifolia]
MKNTSSTSFFWKARRARVHPFVKPEYSPVVIALDQQFAIRQGKLGLACWLCKLEVEHFA